MKIHLKMKMVIAAATGARYGRAVPGERLEGSPVVYKRPVTVYILAGSPIAAN
jgi:hypothetical protein